MVVRRAGIVGTNDRAEYGELVGPSVRAHQRWTLRSGVAPRSRRAVTAAHAEKSQKEDVSSARGSGTDKANLRRHGIPIGRSHGELCAGWHFPEIDISPGVVRRSEFARIETGVADVCRLARRSQVVSQSTTTTMCSPRAARSRTKSMRSRASWSAHSSRSGRGHQLDESTSSLRRFGSSSCSSSSRSVESSATSSDQAVPRDSVAEGASAPRGRRWGERGQGEDREAPDRVPSAGCGCGTGGSGRESIC